MTKVYCDRCGEPLNEGVKPLLLWHWRGDMPADADAFDLCSACREAFKAWLEVMAAVEVE